MVLMRSRKRQMMKVIKLPNQEKNRRKGNLLELENIGSRHHTSGDERKDLKKSISGERENYSKPNNIAEISSKKKILVTSLKVDEGRTSTNEPESKSTTINYNAHGLTSERWHTLTTCVKKIWRKKTRQH